MSITNLVKSFFLSPIPWGGRLSIYPEDLNQNEALPKPGYPDRIGDWIFDPFTGTWNHLGDPRYPATQGMNDLLTESRQQATAAEKEAIDRLYDQFVRKPSSVPGYNGVKYDVSRDSAAAQGWSPIRKDPLTLDLDGDGLEATTPNPFFAIQFDHDGDGSKTGSGWINSDDAFLALDRNGNGTIDSGADLFGDSTPLASGGHARDGFAALSQEDTNGDGVVNAEDARFADLRLWRDLNQDGVSDAGELFTLGSQNITSLSLAKTGTGAAQGNNRISDLGTFTRTASDGSQTTHTMGDIDLFDSPFRRTFATAIPLTATAQALPEMQGSGWVRDLREAMSLGSSAAGSLVSAVSGLSAGTTRASQRAYLDSIAQAWALSSSKVRDGVLDPAYTYMPPQETGPAVVVNSNPGAAPVLRYEFSGVNRVEAGTGIQIVQSVDPVTQATLFQYIAPIHTQAYLTMMARLKVLEVFNAQPFVDTRNYGVNGWSDRPGYVTDLGNGVYQVSLSGGDGGQTDLINRAYNALVDSVYESLAKQTRLAAYMDAIELNFANGAMAFNFAPLVAKLDTTFATDKANALIDLAELLRFDGDPLREAGWFDTGATKMRAWADTVRTSVEQGDTSLATALTSNGIRLVAGNVVTDGSSEFIFGGAGNDTIDAMDGGDVVAGGAGNDNLKGHNGSDALFGEAGDDTLEGGDGGYGNDSSDLLDGGDGADWLYGREGGDTLIGGTGDDQLFGGEGDDVLIGGAGNDRLLGEGGSDVYRFGRGGGHDTIDNGNRWENIYNKRDVIQFDADVLSTDVVIERPVNFWGDLSDYNWVVFRIADTGDTIRVDGEFANDGFYQSGYDGVTSVEEVRFADGTVWNLDEVKRRLLLGTEAGESIWGFEQRNDVIEGAGGNDIIGGFGGADTLNGGAGDDVLHGGDGNDLIDGGAGNDQMDGGAGVDTYRFGRGDGQDVVWYTNPDNADVVILKGGILPTDIVFSRLQTYNDDALVISIRDSTDSLRISGQLGGLNDDLTSGGISRVVKELRFENGTVWDMPTILQQMRIVLGTSGDDVLSSTVGVRSTVNGGAGNDTIAGNQFNGTLNGDGGNDTISGGSGNETLNGGDGDDALYGGAGADYLSGGAGNDILKGGFAADGDPSASEEDRDTLEGGTGDDYMAGGWGGNRPDNYVHRRGDGVDTIEDNSGNWSSQNRLILPDMNLADIKGLERSGNDLQIRFSDAGQALDAVKLNAHLIRMSVYNDLNIYDVQFANGLVRTLASLSAELGIRLGAGDDVFNGLSGGTGASSGNRFFGEGGNDILTGQAWVDVFDGGAGNDTLYGADGDDNLTGGANDDYLEGGEGNDTLSGGTGTDWLKGGYNAAYKDTYIYRLGDGVDTIDDAYGSNGSSDRLKLPDFNLSSLQRIEGDGYNFKLVFSAADQIILDAALIRMRDYNDLNLFDVEFADGTVMKLTDVFANKGIYLGAGDDFFGGLSTGTVSVDRVFGEGGNDRIEGRGGDDVLDGGTGNDTLLGGVGNDVLVGGSGNDVLYGEGTTLPTGLVTRTLTINAKGSLASGVGPAMEVRFDGVVVQTFAVSNTTAYQGYSVDVTYARDSSHKIDITFTNDAMDSSGNDRNLYLQDFTLDGNTIAPNMSMYDMGTGGAAYDGLGVRPSTGGTMPWSGSLRFQYFGSNDSLDGGAGQDQMFGGLGNDTYVIDDAGDQVTEVVDGGIDTVNAGATFTLTANVENLQLTGTGSINGTGNELANILKGNSGSNIITGGGGDDVLDGLAGADTLIGGQGDDNYYVDNVGDVVTENIGEGTDTVYSAVSYTLGANVEQLFLQGGATSGTGNTVNNIIYGTANANVLDGGAGADAFVGGGGDDTYYVDNTGDSVTEYANQGWDAVYTSVNRTIDANIEALVAQNGSGAQLTGSGGAEALFGSADAMANTLIGGNGDDQYHIDTIDVVVEAAGGGIDTVNIWNSYALVANVENLVLGGSGNYNGTGNGLDNVITGNAYNNILDGGTGNDTLLGGVGNDVLVGGSGNDVLYGEGTTLPTGLVTRTLTINAKGSLASGVGPAMEVRFDGVVVQTFAVSNTTAYQGYSVDVTYARDSSHKIDITFTNDAMDSSGNDRNLYLQDFTLDGNTIAPNMSMYDMGTGGAAYDGLGVRPSTGGTMPWSGSLRFQYFGSNDSLDGGAGQDQMFGGLGNDTYVIDDAGDQVTEVVDGGIDTVNAGATFTLTANVENLQLTGTGSINGTGNELANILKGNSGSNIITGGGGDDVLDGLAGADTLIGGQGDDNYYVDNVGDVVTENIGEGTDTVYSAVSYTLGANVEQLFLQGGATSGTGNTVNNIIYGTANANVLDGGAGADAFVGGGGDDTYYVDNTGDSVTEYANQGWDAVYTSVNRTIDANIEALVAQNGSGAQLTGSGGAEALFGSADAMANTLIGGNGDDQYHIDTIDVVVEAAGGGIDTVNIWNSYALVANVENLVLGGSGNYNGTGNGLDNVITGNAYNNILDGGTGNDTLLGGVGNDSYILGRGYGSDLVQESDATAGNADVAKFLTGVATDQLWFRQVGNDLETSIIGTSDKFLFQNWYSGSQYHVEQFKTTDGNKTLLDSQVQNLVNAMAAFSPPAAGQTTLPSNYSTTLNPVMASNWQ
jgi:trimeric autotransporter adhesin